MAPQVCFVGMNFMDSPTSDYDSALMTVINGNTPEHLEMIGSEVIQRLLADKWKAFAEANSWEGYVLEKLVEFSGNCSNVWHC